MKTPAHTETTLVREALQALETVTGARGRILLEPATKNRHFRPDAIVEIVLEGRKLTFLAEVKRTDRLEILGHVRAQLETAIQTEFPNHRPLLITPFMTRELAERADVIVTMGCGDRCPYVPSKRYIEWDLPDPKGRPLAEVRATREEIERRIGALIDELDAG